MSSACLRLCRQSFYLNSSVTASSCLSTSMSKHHVSNHVLNYVSHPYQHPYSTLSTLTSKMNALHLIYPPHNHRTISTTQPKNLKTITEETKNDITVVEGVYIKSHHEDYLVKNELADKKVCPLCALNLNLKHTDVLVLSQFVREDGRLLPRRVTGLCVSQQYKVLMLVTMAKKAGLMTNLGPKGSHKDPAKRRGSRKYHMYFDENTIKDTRLRNIGLYKEIGFAGVNRNSPK